YINKFNGFNESIVIEFTTTLKDMHETVKGLQFKVHDEILATVTRLLVEGEMFPAKSNPEEACVEFADKDDNFVANRQ
ncbi:hypothetical protein KI387_040154, partial [Taxus chinensis]